MQQEPLFYEDLNDAIRATVQALGGVKKVGHELWPTLGVEGAGSKLRDCLNPERRQDLDPMDLLAIMKMGRAHGVHTLAAFICGEAGYSAPIPVDPEDERAELQRQVIAAADQFKSLIGRLERVSLQGSIVPVSRVR